MDEHNRPSTQFQVAGIEIGPLFDDRFLLSLFPLGIVSANPDSMLSLGAHRFDHTDAAVRDRPIDFWSVIDRLSFPVRVCETAETTRTSAGYLHLL